MDLEEFQNYYRDNIILQYKSKPKACATIKNLSKVNYLNSILDRFKNIWNLEESNGIFLDLIGQLLGIDRIYIGLNIFKKYFATPYARNVPTPTPLQAGFQVGNVETLGEWFMHHKALSSTMELSDNVYREVLRMKIFSRSCNNSAGEIQDMLDERYSGSILKEFYSPNQIVYSVPFSIYPIFLMMEYKKALPRASGIELSVEAIYD